jgi:hypothetical protein
MVIGSGLVANSLASLTDDGSVLVFASGVSNSGQKDPAAFARERDALLRHSRTTATLVYFSTCSIYDPDAKNSDYVKHKLEMEKLIAVHFPNHIILRLPNLIANSPNPFTFFNFITNRILLAEPLRVHQHAWRYILDAEDLGQFVPLLLREHQTGAATINMAYSNATPVPELIGIFETILHKKALKEMVPVGSYYEFDNSGFLSFLERNRFSFSKESYNYQTLYKYLSVLRG